MDAYLSSGHDAVVADFSACDERIDDCSGLRFVFRQLTVDFAGGTIKLGAEAVGALTYDARTAQAVKEGRFYFGPDGIDHAYVVSWAAGWRLSHRVTAGADRVARVSVSLEK